LLTLEEPDPSLPFFFKNNIIPYNVTCLTFFHTTICTLSYESINKFLHMINYQYSLQLKWKFMRNMSKNKHHVYSLQKTWFYSWKLFNSLRWTKTHRIWQNAHKVKRVIGKITLLKYLTFFVFQGLKDHLHLYRSKLKGFR